MYLQKLKLALVYNFGCCNHHCNSSVVATAVANTELVTCSDQFYIFAHHIIYLSWTKHFIILWKNKIIRNANKKVNIYACRTGHWQHKMLLSTCMDKSIAAAILPSANPFKTYLYTICHARILVANANIFQKIMACMQPHS